MGWDVSDYSGYIIKASVLMSGFPEALRELASVSPKRGSNSTVWADAQPAIFGCLHFFVANEIDSRLTVDAMGDWYGTIEGSSPFEPGETYFVFPREDLIDEKRVSGKSIEKDSAAFKSLKKFMESHGIPESELRYEEWQFGG
jgi:hypothetical protein